MTSDGCELRDWGGACSGPVETYPTWDVLPPAFFRACRRHADLQAETYRRFNPGFVAPQPLSRETRCDAIALQRLADEARRVRDAYRATRFVPNAVTTAMTLATAALELVSEVRRLRGAARDGAADGLFER